MTPYAWASLTLDLYHMTRAMRNDLLECNERVVILATTRNDQGLPVNKEMCPKRLWISADAEASRVCKATPLPDLFYTGSYWIVSARAADQIGSFDLGQGALHPVDDGIYFPDNESKVDRDFFCWIYGNVKYTFLLGPSRNTSRPSPDDPQITVGETLADDDLALSDLALNGSDVWLERNVRNCVFLTGALDDKLSKAGLADTFELRRCRIVRTSGPNLTLGF